MAKEHFKDYTCTLISFLDFSGCSVTHSSWWQRLWQVGQVFVV